MIETRAGDGSVEPTYAIRRWGRNRIEAGGAGKRVLLMPGTGYNCDRPLLYSSAMALIDDGWYVDRLDVNADLSKTPSSRIIAMLGQAVDEWLAMVKDDAKTAGRTPTTLLIAKSLSTLVYPHAFERGVPIALLTPVLAPADFDPTHAVIPVPGDADYPTTDDDPAAQPAPEPLVCAGTADPLYDHDRAVRLTHAVHEYPRANHSIEVRGDWRASLSYLNDVVAQVHAYAQGIARSR